MKRYELLATPNSNTKKINENREASPTEYYPTQALSQAKYKFYENTMMQIGRLVSQMAKEAQTSGLRGDDVDYLLNDTFPRLEDAVAYAKSVVEVLRNKKEDED